MLILMRRAGEAIHIGPDIVITLVSLDRNRARIGIQAPRDIPVDREEIAKKKQSGIAPPLERNAESSDAKDDEPV
jgi:carbon storage regulator